MYIERLNLAGRTALVTGGASGIGLACVEALAEFGAHVTIADLQQVELDRAAEILAAKGVSAQTIIMDVTDSARVTAVADQIGAMDILVNNAGIARSETPAELVTDEHWQNVLDVNLNGSFWCARALGRHMLSAGRGSIVNVGSMSGFGANTSSSRRGDANAFRVCQLFGRPISVLTAIRPVAKVSGNAPSLRSDIQLPAFRCAI